MTVDQRINIMNGQQRSAFNAIINGWDAENGDFNLPIVEGPPGTGKTSVGALAAAQYSITSEVPQISYLCFTNFAADRALESFIELGFNNLQVARVVDGRNFMNYQNSNNSTYYINADNVTPNQQRQLRETPILITTLHSARRAFDYKRQPLIVIDEYSQVPPHLFFSTLSKVRTSVYNPSGYALLGDPNQLPVMTSQPLLRPNIGNFISSRVDYEPHQLNTQYRMHPHICQSVNALRESLNTYPLESHDSVNQRNLENRDIGYNWDESKCYSEFREILNPRNTCVIINTERLEGRDEMGLIGSRFFLSEARLAANLTKCCYNSYNKGNENLKAAVLSPYNAQIGAIKDLLPDELKNCCMTIHKSQGREYPCVIVSFSRNNPERSIGFLAEPDLRAQSYVACSRAMAKLIVLFSFSTFRGYRDYDFLLEKSKNAYIIDASNNWIRDDICD